MIAVADHLWQSTLGAAAAGALALLLRRHRAAVRHGVWCAAAAKFYLPWAALVALGGVLPSPAMSAPAASSTLVWLSDAVGQPFTATRALAVTTSAEVPGLLASIPWTPILIAVWAAGAFWTTAMMTARWLAVWRIAWEANPATTGREWERLQKAVHRTGISQRVALRLTDVSLEPGVIGIRRPRLLWPRALGVHLSDMQIEAIVLHEISHVRRRDNLVGLLFAPLQIACWWNPAVWMIGRALMVERERACDEDVVRMHGDAQSYAEGILRTCAHHVEARLAFVAGVSGGDLQRRIVDIMQADARVSLTGWRRVLTTGVVGMALVGPVGVGVAEQTPMPAVQAQDAAEPQFEVASVKRNAGGDMAVMLRMQPGGRFTATNMSLPFLIRFAWQLQPSQIVGGPSWVGRERFDISARTAGDDPPLGQVQLMVRGLLAERFKLQSHIETRDTPIYALVLARSDGRPGPKLKPASADCQAMREALRARGSVPPSECGMRLGAGTLHAGGMQIVELARVLSQLTGRVVEDRSGLTSQYDFELSWTPEQSGADPGAGIGGPPLALSDSGGSLFTALQEQLGLKLEPGRGPVEVLVVDSAEIPDPD